MKQKFKRAVDSGDLEGVRISLANEMMLDPRGDNFKEMCVYAEKALPKLYETHDGAIFEQNRDNWDEELLFSTKNALDVNFSRERLEFFYNLAKVVLKDKAKSMEQESRNVGTPSQGEHHENRRVNTFSASLIVAGVVVGGIGLIMSKPIITAIGLVGGVVGGCKIYNDYRK